MTSQFELNQNQSEKNAIMRKIDLLVDSFIRERFHLDSRDGTFGLVTALGLILASQREYTLRAEQGNKEWQISIKLKSKTCSVWALLVQLNKKKPKIVNRDLAKAYITDIKEQEFRVKSVRTKVEIVKSERPLTTARLIEQCEKHFGYSLEKTLQIAKQLCDGLDIGQKKSTRLISNYLTNSDYISEEDMQKIREYIYVNCGKEYLNDKKEGENNFPCEAILPTSLKRQAKKIKKFVSDDIYNVYNLIWARSVFSQISDAKIKRKQIDIEAGPDQRYLFRIVNDSFLFNGFFQFDPFSSHNYKNSKNVELVSNMPVSLIDVKIHKEEKTSPSRYTIGALLSEIAQLNVCNTDSYFPVVDNLSKLSFIRIENHSVIPTQAGLEFSSLLLQNYPDIFSVKLAQRLYKKILTNKSETVLNDFSKLLNSSIFEVSTDSSLSRKLKNKNKNCPICHGKLNVIRGREDFYYVCERYPQNCQYTQKIKENIKNVVGRCPECGHDLVVKKGKFGRFLACETFPNCRYTRSYSINVACPVEGCKGEVVERVTKNGQLFYGCSTYPECTFSSWKKPVNIACKLCGHHFLVLKNPGDDADFYTCPQCKKEYDLNLQIVSKNSFLG